MICLQGASIKRGNSAHSAGIDGEGGSGEGFRVPVLSWWLSHASRSSNDASAPGGSSGCGSVGGARRRLLGGIEEEDLVKGCGGKISGGERETGKNVVSSF